MNTLAAKWLSRAWNLVAATWLAITLGWVFGKADTGQWISVIQFLVPGWLLLDGVSKWVDRSKQ